MCKSFIYFNAVFPTPQDLTDEYFQCHPTVNKGKDSSSNNLQKLSARNEFPFSFFFLFQLLKNKLSGNDYQCLINDFQGENIVTSRLSLYNI